MEQVPGAEQPTVIQAATAAPVSTPEAAAAMKSGLYQDADAALKEVHGSYDYWSGKFNETSLKMSYALIAANWMIFGSVNGILSSQLAKWSLLMPMLAIGTDVAGSWWLGYSLNKQAQYGESHGAEWEKKFKKAAGTDDPFPFTAAQQNAGGVIRAVKALAILTGSVLFVIGAIRK